MVGYENSMHTPRELSLTVVVVPGKSSSSENVRSSSFAGRPDGSSHQAA